MAKRPRTIRHSELLNQLVIDRTTMEELGQIEVVWMYPQVHRVLGFVCHSGFLGKQKAAFKLKQITALGENSVLVTAKPTATDAERVRQLESLIHCEVWSDQGNRVGQIIDFVFDLETGEIHHYLLVTGRLAALTDGIYQLPPRKIMSLGRKRVLIAEATIARLELYQSGIRQTLTKTGEWLKGDLEQVTEELQAWRQEVQAKTQQVGSKLQGWVSRVKRSTQDWTQQTLSQAKQFGETVHEETQTIAKQSKHRSQTWVEQVKESGQTWQQRLNDEFVINLTATEQAEQAAAAKARANLLDEDDFDFDFEDDGSDSVAPAHTSEPTAPPTDVPGATIAEDEWGDWDWDDAAAATVPKQTNAEGVAGDSDHARRGGEPVETRASGTADHEDEWDWDDEWEDGTPNQG
ncbi:PRC-barrel domain-containing protein [Trichothermofontia sp.]